MSTTTILTPFYGKFVAECPTIYLSSYGNEHVMGFKGPKPQIDLMENLFVNYYLDEKGNQPEMPRFNFLWDEMAYICVTEKRVRRMLELFFYLNILRTNEVIKEIALDDDGQKVITRDEVESLARAQYAVEKFMTEYVVVKTFMPATNTSQAVSHSVGNHNSEIRGEN